MLLGKEGEEKSHVAQKKRFQMTPVPKRNESLYKKQSLVDSFFLFYDCSKNIFINSIQFKKHLFFDHILSQKKPCLKKNLVSKKTFF